MAWRVRSSKFRHVFGSPAKKEQCYECIKITKNAHDSNFCAANPKFVAVVTEAAGGGSFLVIPIDKPGRVDINGPKVCGHSGPVLDIKWNPFNDHVVASCSDDATIKLWQIPEDGLKANVTEWLVDLHGHQRRVGYIEWHPTAENILLSAGYDFKCIIWNTECAEPINIISCHNDTIFSIAWSRDGSMFATTCKDKKVRVIDPRGGTIISEGLGHQGTKASKVIFIGDNNRLFTTGFSRMSERQYSIWDCKNLSKPLKTESIDSSSGVMLPYYDYDTNVVFVAGKGDGNIRYYEIVNDPPYCHFLSQYQSGSPQRGLGVMCKRGVDTGKCEIVRFYKLHTSKNLMEPISMIVPRKSEMFQDDIFPPTAGSCPSLTADEWISGQNRDPILISLKDGVVSQSPTITTYKAVKRGSSLMDTGTGSTASSKRNPGVARSVSMSAATTTTTTTHNDKLPMSVRNIKKLSSVEENRDRVPARDPDKVTIYDSQRPITRTESTTRYTNTNSPIRVDKKTWQTAYTSSSNDIPTTNGVPKTDPELQLEQSAVFSSRPTPADPVAEASASPFRRSASLRGSRIKLGGSLYNQEKSIAEETRPYTRDNGDIRIQSTGSVSSDHFYTPPSSPQRHGPGAQGEISPFMNGTPVRSVWADNPVYSTGKEYTGKSPVSSLRHLGNGDNVDTTPLDDILSDVLKDFESTASHLTSHLTDPSLKKAKSEYFAVPAPREKVDLPSLQGSHRAKSDNSIERSVMPGVRGTFASEAYQPQGVPGMPGNVDSETDDLDKQAMLDCISQDAPDDTLIKPSKLRASMRSRKARASFRGGARSSPDSDLPSPGAEPTSNYVSPLASPRVYSASSSDVTKPYHSSQPGYHNGQPGYHQSNSSDLHIGDNHKSMSRPELSSYGTTSASYGPDNGHQQRETSEINNNKLRFVRRSRRDERSKTDVIDYRRGSESSQPTSNGRPHKYSLDGGPLGDQGQDKYGPLANQGTDRYGPLANQGTDRYGPLANQATDKYGLSNQAQDKFVFKMNSEAPDSLHVTHAGAAPFENAYPAGLLSRQPPGRSKSEPEIDDVNSSHLTRKVWGSSQAHVDTQLTAPSLSNGLPSSDLELRKAYFRQLEEIRSLKEQISMKDKRIHHLEDEMRGLRSTDPSESNC